MSGLWTPSGEHRPRTPDDGTPDDRTPDDGPPAQHGPGEVDEAALAEELRRVRAELAVAPVAEIIANHAVGLWQLAVLHLSPEEGEAPRLEQASTAIDAMAGIVEGVGDRLGEYAEALRDALAQLRVAFVQIRDGSAAPDADAPDAESPDA